jgi:UDP-N-acetylglucosamine 2-epimerase (non-hydrolysing)
MSQKKRVLIVVGTRPNIIKITQFKKHNQDNDNLEFKVVHTGQHYDEKMASSFFSQLGVLPDFFLNVPALSANSQIAHILLGLEGVCKEYQPDLVMPVGDVNSTLAAAIAANKLGIKLAHLEAGLRSFDRSMPEEHNRIITDDLSDIFFVTEKSGYDNLVKEGKTEGNIHWVGNTMIDTLVAFNPEIRKSGILSELGLTKNAFVLMTMHRPSNVDAREGLEQIISLIRHFSEKYRVVFPVHPRTLNRMKEYNLLSELEHSGRVILTEPKDYFSFQQLIAECSFVVTDSGGVQEETTFRGVPCFTLRPNTERPSTITDGTNQLVTFDNVRQAVSGMKATPGKGTKIPMHWDGKSTERIVKVLEKIL